MQLHPLLMLVHGVQAPVGVACGAVEGTAVVLALVGIVVVGEPGPAERDAAADRAGQRLGPGRHPEPAVAVIAGWARALSGRGFGRRKIVKDLASLQGEGELAPGLVGQPHLAALPFGPALASGLVEQGSEQSGNHTGPPELAGLRSWRWQRRHSLARQAPSAQASSWRICSAWPARSSASKPPNTERSEERRVGKECRAWWGVVEENIRRVEVVGVLFGWM